ncbi:MAG: class I SAM-dependent methyltransferase [Methylobacter sp.]
MKTISTEMLETYVKFVDSEAGGNLKSAKVAEKFFPLNLTYKTVVDETLSPFSDEYYQAQVTLYEEISSKKLDQWSGELHPVNIPGLLNCPNPLGINDVKHISENVRALTSMLSISSLGVDAEVLDLGAGHGLSSEVYAFCGCRVHSIDIDPGLCDLAMQRAQARSLRVTRSVMNFDSLVSVKNNFYDAAFFFQSLHHCLRPWELIAELKTKLSETGIIGFCGEPVQNNWWKHWGIRLDPESIYVARKYGWFESGWSSAFIIECFKRNGLELALLQGGHRGGFIGITSKDKATLSNILVKAAELGMLPIGAMDIEVSLRNYRSQIGELMESNPLRPTMRANSTHLGGYLCYGPYISLKSGRYRVSFILNLIGGADGSVQQEPMAMFDIVSAGGTLTYHKEEVRLGAGERARFLDVEFDLAADARLVEARVHIPQRGAIWEASLPIFTRII